MEQARRFFRPANISKGFTSKGTHPWQYIYTEGVGWIDITHFFNATSYGSDVGYSVEIYQWIVSSPSAWSYEDLQSNLQGALFAMNNRSLKDGEAFYSALSDWFEGLFATTPENAPNWSSLPPFEKEAGAYGDNGRGGNRGLPIPTVYSELHPIFAPRFNQISPKYKKHVTELRPPVPIYVTPKGHQ